LDERQTRQTHTGTYFNKFLENERRLTIPCERGWPLGPL